ncbi:MAG: hypothetical protein LBB74_00455 [Chitinispirillales bacterium]|jgi:hypothetical protein|nr:hypothetical protein [Chitinispirillales bacterium]
MKLSKLALTVVTVAVAVGFAQAQKQPKSERAGVGEKSAVSKTMSFNATEVQGYIDTQSPVAIIDIDAAEQEPIVLNRSFKDALKENVDRESLERVSFGK